ncbi:MAG: SRPBCC family protein [bacterium]
MKSNNYSTAFNINQSPEEAFAIINDVRSWWTGSPGVEGNTAALGDVFTYTHTPWHVSTQKIAESIPGKRVVWDVTESNLSFIEDHAEWVGTQIVFEISKRGDRTEVRFSHIGLVPEIECYKACSGGWDSIINGNLFNRFGSAEVGNSKIHADAFSYTTSFTVDNTPEEAFTAINNVRGWWSEEIEGITDKIGEEWQYHYEDVHRCTMKVTELVPSIRVAWKCLDNYFNFTKDKSEWKGNDLIFEISQTEGKTEVHFTQKGLVPAYECFDICANAWGSYITSSLKALITKGKGKPNQKQDSY